MSDLRVKVHEDGHVALHRQPYPTWVVMFADGTTGELTETEVFDWRAAALMPLPT